MLKLARFACLLGAFAFAGPTFAQTISSTSPTNIEGAAVGTTITINGSDFGVAKPKVQLFDSVTNKKYALKVATFSDSQITATISKAVSGEFSLQVIVKGAAAPAETPMTIRAPLVTSLSVASAGPNAPFSILGDFFGTKKGKIRVNGQNAKIVSWAMNEIQLLMPKKLPNGFWTIAVDNKVGVDDGATIQVVGSTVKIGKATLNAYINGTKLKLKYGQGAVPGNYAVVAVGASGSYPSGEALVIGVPFFDGNNVPEDYVWGTNLFVVSYFEYKVISKLPVTKAYLPANGFTVNITANSAGQVAGNFHGTLANVANQLDTVSCDGDFVVDIIDL